MCSILFGICSGVPFAVYATSTTTMTAIERRRSLRTILCALLFVLLRVVRFMLHNIASIQAQSMASHSSEKCASH